MWRGFVPPLSSPLNRLLVQLSVSFHHCYHYEFFPISINMVGCAMLFCNSGLVDVINWMCPPLWTLSDSFNFVWGWRVTHNNNITISNPSQVKSNSKEFKIHADTRFEANHGALPLSDLMSVKLPRNLKRGFSMVEWSSPVSYVRKRCLSVAPRQWRVQWQLFPHQEKEKRNTRAEWQAELDWQKITSPATTAATPFLTQLSASWIWGKIGTDTRREDAWDSGEKFFSLSLEWLPDGDDLIVHAPLVCSLMALWVWNLEGFLNKGL